jgi:hypothetical protein
MIFQPGYIKLLQAAACMQCVPDQAKQKALLNNRARIASKRPEPITTTNSSQQIDKCRASLCQTSRPADPANFQHISRYSGQMPQLQQQRQQQQQRRAIAQ